MWEKIELDEFKDIISLFEKDAESEVSVRYDMGRLFIDGDGNELMLRIHAHTKQLVIARIVFNQMRNGYGSTLLDYLKTYGKNHGYETIMMESVLTKEATNFCHKHGFVKDQNGLPVIDNEFSFYGNYSLAI